jgi:PAS domain S-box-containing protein
VAEALAAVVGGRRELLELEYHVHGPGGPRCFEVRAVGFAQDGRRRVLVVQREFTERRHREIELRTAEARYRGMVERIHDGLLVHDGTHILYANPSAERALGCTKAGGLVGLAVLDLVAPEFRELVAGRIGLVLASGLPSEPAKMQLLRQDGARLPVEVFGVPAVYDGRMAIQVMFRVIGARECAGGHEPEARPARLRHTERLAVIGSLAAGIAHEINNPTGAILLAAKNALSHLGRAGGEEVAGRCLRDIVRSARRCAGIVRSVLQLARQEPLERWEADLNNSVRHAVEQAEPYARARGAVVEFHPGADVPPVVFNPLGIEQVVVNLIHNACEAGSGGGVWVRVSTLRSERGVQIRVSDNGRGLAREEIEKIFDPFFTTRREEGGTGLGLSVAHGIVVQHGGTIWVESEPGRGSRITVELPLTPGASSA